MVLFWCFFFALWTAAALAVLVWGHFYAVFAVGRKHPVESSQILAWLGHQRRQSCDDKSAGVPILVTAGHPIASPVSVFQGLCRNPGMQSVCPGLLNRKSGFGFESTEDPSTKSTFRQTQAENEGASVCHIDMCIKVTPHPVNRISLEIAPLIIIDETGCCDAGARRTRAQFGHLLRSVAHQWR